MPGKFLLPAVLACVTAIPTLVSSTGFSQPAQVNPPTPAARADHGTVSARSLPAIFISALAEVKSRSHVPVLLPTGLSGPLAGAKAAIVDGATMGKYSISLYYSLGEGDTGFAAFFTADTSPDYDPRELGNVREVSLAHGLPGYFRPVSCGGSCAPANLWWQESGVLYQIQLSMSPEESERAQQRAIVRVADSAILAGPR